MLKIMFFHINKHEKLYSIIHPYRQVINQKENHPQQQYLLVFLILSYGTGRFLNGKLSFFKIVVLGGVHCGIYKSS
jgi:hypothetical protein